MVALSRRTSEPTRRNGQANPVWHTASLVDRGLVRLVGNLEISGSIPTELRGGPLLVAANHIGMFDPFVLIAAFDKIGLSPRFLLTGGLLDAPVLGWILRQGGHVRVDRGKSTVVEAFNRATDALHAAGGPVLVYPEGRVSREPGLWPERGKSGVARMALAAKVPVLTISQWGAHEAVYWGTETVGGWSDVKPLLTSSLRAIRARPTFKVHFGPVVDLSDLSFDKSGDAIRAHKRIMQTITDNLVPLRTAEPDTPRFHDPTRPTDSRSPWRPRPE